MLLTKVMFHDKACYLLLISELKHLWEMTKSMDHDIYFWGWSQVSGEVAIDDDGCVEHKVRIIAQACARNLRAVISRLNVQNRAGVSSELTLNDASRPTCYEPFCYNVRKRGRLQHWCGAWTPSSFISHRAWSGDIELETSRIERGTLTLMPSIDLELNCLHIGPSFMVEHSLLDYIPYGLEAGVSDVPDRKIQ